MDKIKYTIAGCFLLLSLTAFSQTTELPPTELYRPQFHFTPREHWMNDPNGLIFYKGQYHIFYQYYPGGTVWGPMHWGHATSTDLFHWKEQPIALYPDSLGYIFSGSAVLDAANSTGLGKDGKPPLVAIFTYHNMDREKAKRNDFQYQGIAFSHDDGKTWIKYSGNPVLNNPGITDFRDPKLSWYAPGKKWIMTLATKDRITFYASPDLKNWHKLSEFGKVLGAHGGVWECPDLLPFEYKGKKIWALLVSINPGGPNGGSATQYFLGDFDGTNFIPTDTATRWIDYGTDNYAGVSFFNTGKRTIFLGWMSNWQYAQQVPTEKWRSAMTLPRNLSIQSAGGKLVLASTPVEEMKVIKGTTLNIPDNSWKKDLPATHLKNTSGSFQLDFTANAAEDFVILLSNDDAREVLIGYRAKTREYYIDRSNSGETSFEKGFGKKHLAPRLSTEKTIDLTLVVDKASVELFADKGCTVMTDIVFPKKPYTNLRIETTSPATIRQVKYTPLKPSMVSASLIPQ
ncbi:glycoside hydrolase family 32 protein [Flavihumibacter fluvii]|uniref:glycoside hydrolase family 32 protein n=1 Tax=Flavihumibacter fluvii TaxID=2838157 RepID=UPI001BDE27CA|nr:glycoside hydrolase family 32 protein [Flavihumibacter fluvii]ULQ50853.1 glycoside hydrolase family 32 protein [Flavihumibacter fluvii]